MKHKHLAIVVIAFITVFVWYSYAEMKNKPHPQNIEVMAEQDTRIDKEEIQTIVREFILDNPEIIVESVEKMQSKKSKDAEQKRTSIIEENLKELTENPTDPKLGNLKSKNYVVEFFDYSCGYCKRMLPVKEKLLSENKDLKIIFKEFPVLGEFSELAAKTSLAVYRIEPKKYKAFHKEMLSLTGPRTKESIDAVLEKLELDKDKVHEAAKDPKIDEALSKNRELAIKLGIMGSPAYIVNNKFQAGALEYSDIKEMLK